MKTQSAARLTCAVLVWALGSSACSSSDAKDYGDPTALSISTESLGIIASVISPTERMQNQTASVQVVLSAYTREPSTPIEASIGKLEAGADGEDVEVGMQRAEVSGAPGPEQRFTVSLPLVHGSNRIFVRLATADRTRVRTLSFLLDYAGANPGLTLGVSVPALLGTASETCSDADELATPITNRRFVCVHGRVTSSSGNVSGTGITARVSVPGGAASAAPIDASGRYAVPVEVPPNQSSLLQLDVSEGALLSTSRYALLQDETPPVIAITSTATETSAAQLTLQGSASDPSGIRALALDSPSGGHIVLDPAATFSHDVLLGSGENPLSVVATDGAGNISHKDVTLTRLRVLRLGAPRRNVGTTDIEVGRQALGELIEPDDQKTIELASIDLGPAVRQALERIREPTRFGVDTSKWGAPEQNLQRILSMTPDVANLSGTSVAELLTIASGVGLPAPRLLAQLLDLTVTDFILDLDIATQVIVDNLVGTHPSIARDAAGKPVLSVSMFDVLSDLTTVGPRFGPSGAHPGFLSPATLSQVLEPGFLLTFPVHSNLAQYDAVDLSQSAKAFLFLLEGERALDFNVLTDGFSVVGLVDEPAIDLRFLLTEAPTFTRAGNNKSAAPDPSDPGFFRGNGQGFALPPYLFENISAEIGYRQLHRAFNDTGFQRTNRYDAGSIKDAAVVAWDHGWVTITSAGGLGAPPPPLYAWDLLMETAEVRLHDQGVAEGKADMAFALTGLPIGLSADDLVEKLKPKLNEQQDKLSDLLVGSSGLATSGADIFYVPAQTGDGALFFRDQSDGGNAVTYAKPGFYADVALTNKFSSTAAGFGSTDTVHEKVAAAVGATYYAADETGAVFQILVVDRDPSSVGLQIRKAGGAP